MVIESIRNNIYQDDFYVKDGHLVPGEVPAIRENGATSGVGALATYSYDDYGRVTGIARGKATELFASQFAAEMAAGSSIVAAPRAAEYHLRWQPRYSQPAFWSGFSIIGDGTKIIPPAGRRGKGARQATPS